MKPNNFLTFLLTFGYLQYAIEGVPCGSKLMKVQKRSLNDKQIYDPEGKYSDFSPLRIMVLASNNFNRLPFDIQSSFDDAIRHMADLVAVKTHSRPFVLKKGIEKCARDWIGSNEQLYPRHFRNDARHYYDDYSKTIDLHYFGKNFALFLYEDYDLCKRDPAMLAAANPCQPDNAERPLAAAMILCPNNRAWTNFEGGFDLFRHEILHALGYGTFNAKRPVPPIHYPWKLAHETHYWQAQFMDFATDATAYAKYHFDCAQLDGVEGDADKIHLDEYMYGNELMTPNIGNGRNYFTSISAKILEETFTSKQWYRVNQRIVDEETQLYWYGKKWGCAFAKKSCAEFIKEKERGYNKGLEIPAFPFCNADNLEDSIRDDRKLKLCVTNGTSNRYVRSRCSTDRRRRRDSSSERLPTFSLFDYFGNSISRRVSDSVGSEAQRRYCPFVDFIAKEDTEMGHWPANSRITTC